MMALSPFHAVLVFSVTAVVAMVSFLATVWHQTRLAGAARWRGSQHSSDFDASWRQLRIRFRRSKLEGICFLFWTCIQWKRRTWVGRVDLTIVGSLVALCSVVLGIGFWDVVLALIKLVTALIELVRDLLS